MGVPAYMWMLTFICAHMKAKSQYWLHPLSLLHHGLFREGPFTKPEAHGLARMTARSLWDPPMPAQRTQDHRCKLRHPFFFFYLAGVAKFIDMLFIKYILTKEINN